MTWKKVKVKSFSCVWLWDPMDCNLQGSSVHGIFQARILERGCHFLLQEIFPMQGLNPGLPHCRQTFYVWAMREGTRLERQKSLPSELTTQMQKMSFCLWLPLFWLTTFPLLALPVLLLFDPLLNKIAGVFCWRFLGNEWERLPHLCWSTAGSVPHLVPFCGG